MAGFTALRVIPVDGNGLPLIAGGSGYTALPVNLVDGNNNIITAFPSIAQGGGSVTINANGQITASTPAGQSIILQPGSSTDLVRIPQGSVQITNGFLGVLSAPSTANAVTIGSNTSLTGTSQRGVFATLTHDATGTTDAVIFQGIQTLTAGSTWARVGGVVMGAITQNSATINKFAAFGTDNQTVTITNNFIGCDLNDQSGVHAANAYGFHLTNIAGGSSNTAGVHIQQVSGTGTNNYGVFVGAVAGATNNYAILTSGGTHSFTTSAGASGNLPGQDYIINLGSGLGSGRNGQLQVNSTISGAQTTGGDNVLVALNFSSLTQDYAGTTEAFNANTTTDTGTQNYTGIIRGTMGHVFIQTGGGTVAFAEGVAGVVQVNVGATGTLSGGFGTVGEFNLNANVYTVTAHSGIQGSVNNLAGGTISTGKAGNFFTQISSSGPITVGYGVYSNVIVNSGATGTYATSGTAFAAVITHGAATTQPLMSGLTSQMQVTNTGGTITVAENIRVQAPSLTGAAAITTHRGVRISNLGAANIGTVEALRIDAQSGSSTNIALYILGGLVQIPKITQYNGVATAGYGVGAIYGSAQLGTTTNSTATIASYTNGAANGVFRVSAHINVTVGTTMAMTVTVTYHDVAGTSRTQTLQLVRDGTTVFLANGSIVTTGDYVSMPIEFVCQASTTISVQTAGTVTTTTYTGSATIEQMN